MVVVDRVKRGCCSSKFECYLAVDDSESNLIYLKWAPMYGLTVGTSSVELKLEAEPPLSLCSPLSLSSLLSAFAPTRYFFE